MNSTLHNGDAITVLRTLLNASVDCCVTSPPYWGLRDYGVAGQLGLERTPQEYVEKMVAVFREVRRVLKDDGTLWLNLGDSYASNVGGGASPQGFASARPKRSTPPGLKAKDLVGIPWRVAFALQADGWCLRSDIIWSKPNPMPESITDRPTKAHEYVFLLSKSGRYYFDADAIAEPALNAGRVVGYSDDSKSASTKDDPRFATRICRDVVVKDTRNKRSVWTIPSDPFPGDHFAVMPTSLARTCVLAGCRAGGTVLDPFTGSGTVGVVAMRESCSFVGVELNPEYAKMARDRIAGETPAMLLDNYAPPGAGRE